MHRELEPYFEIGQKLPELEYYYEFARGGGIPDMRYMIQMYSWRYQIPCRSGNYNV